MHSDNKSVFAERVIRTIKEYIIAPFNRSKGIWYEYIDAAVNKHNNHVNKDTGYTPNDIWKKNIEVNNIAVINTIPFYYYEI